MPPAMTLALNGNENVTTFRLGTSERQEVPFIPRLVKQAGSVATQRLRGHVSSAQDARLPR